MRPGCFQSTQQLGLIALLALLTLDGSAETPTSGGTTSSTNAENQTSSPGEKKGTDGTGNTPNLDPTPFSTAKDLFGGFHLGKETKPNLDNANFRFGDVTIDLTGFFITTYDTNINQSKSKPLSDVILEAGFTFGTYWDISSTNSFSFNTTISYTKYLRNPQFDSSSNFLNIQPETELAYYLKLGEVQGKIYDRLSYDIEPGQRYFFDPSTGTLNPSVQYPRWDNLAGLSLNWEPLRDWVWGLNTNRSDTIPDDKQFENLKRTSYNTQLSLDHQINSDLTAGVFTGYSETSYAQTFNNDSKGWNYGYNLRYSLSPYLVGSWRHTFNDMTFSRGGFNGDTTDYAGQNYEAGLAHQPVRDISHGVQWSRASDLGFASNTRETDTYTYYINYLGLPEGTLSGRYSYSTGGDSGGKFAEQFILRFYEISYSRQLTRKLNMSTAYSNTNKDSNLPFGEHVRNQVSLRLNYDF